MAETNESWQATRETLLSRLRDWGDDQSWNEFFRLYWNLIYSVAKRAGLSDVEAQDVTQETVVTVAKQMPEFSYDRSKGSFRSWLCNTTRWKIKDQFKRRQRQERLHQELPSTREEHSGESNDFETLWAEEWEENLVHLSVERIRSQVDSEEYDVFDLYTLKGWPAARIARHLKMDRPRVYYLNQKVTRILNEASLRIRGELEP